MTNQTTAGWWGETIRKVPLQKKGKSNNAKSKKKQKTNRKLNKCFRRGEPLAQTFPRKKSNMLLFRPDHSFSDLPWLKFCHGIGPRRPSWAQQRHRSLACRLSFSFPRSAKHILCGTPLARERPITFTKQSLPQFHCVRPKSIIGALPFRGGTWEKPKTRKAGLEGLKDSGSFGMRLGILQMPTLPRKRRRFSVTLARSLKPQIRRCAQSAVEVGAVLPFPDSFCAWGHEAGGVAAPSTRKT